MVNSAKARTELAEAYQLPAEHVSIIHTAVDTTNWQPAADETTRAALRRQLCISGDGPVLLSTARDQRRKGPGTLLPALAQMPEARFWVAGQSLHALATETMATVPDLPRDRHRKSEPPPVVSGRRPVLTPRPPGSLRQHRAPKHGLRPAWPHLHRDGAAGFIRGGENGYVLSRKTDAGAIAETSRRIISLTEENLRNLGAAARQAVVPLTGAVGWINQKVAW